MNTQPRDKKGRFVRFKTPIINMGVYEDKELIQLYEQSRQTHKSIIAAQKETIETLEKMLSVKNQTYELVKRQFKRKLILFTSLTFLLGTIFFMLISKK